MMRRGLRIGIAGAGSIVPIAALAACQEISGIEAVAIAARDPAKARAFATRHGIAKAFASFDQMFGQPDIDLVYVAAANAAHAELSIRALEAGKAVLCEKPLATSLAQADRMVATAAGAGRPLLEAFHYRFHPGFVQMLDWLDQGLIGDVESIDAVFCHPIAFDAADARWQPGPGSGVLNDLGCYLVHAIRTLARKEPNSTAASVRHQRGIDVEYRAELAFDGGLIGTMHCSMATPQTRAELSVRGRDGTMVLSDFHIPHRSGRLVVTGRRSISRSLVGTMTTYAAQLAHVCSVLRGEQSPLTGGADSLGNVAVLDRLRHQTRDGPGAPAPW